MISFVPLCVYLQNKQIIEKQITVLSITFTNHILRKDMTSVLILFINAIIVVAQMILDISKNVKRIGEISAEQKKDQSGNEM